MVSTNNKIPNKWVPDCPECAVAINKKHTWIRCDVGKKSNPGWFALTGNDYKIYEECLDCKVCKLKVVRDGKANYTYRNSLKNY